MLAPIVVFVYNRLDHTRELIESLSKNDLAKDSMLFIYSDGAKNEANVEKVEQVRNYISSLDRKGLFGSVTIRCADKNKGLAASVISGVNEVIQEYGKVIVLEDDLILSQHFLSYMNQCLDRYESEKKVFSISGFSRDIAYLHELDVDMYFSCRAQSWSWGTWRDRWNTVDWNVGDYQQFKCNLSERRHFNAGGNDMASMLDRQQCGRINSWAIRFCYAQFKNGGCTVQPRKTLVQNSGQDGSGTHCNFVREYAELSKQNTWRLRDVTEDTDINVQLKKTRKKIPYWKLVGSFVVYVILGGRIKI